MCTVTWFRSKGGYELFFNRDELRSRLPAVAPSAHESDGVSYLAPTDTDRGGTWIGVNEYGVTHCLLNYYDAGGVSAGSPAKGSGSPAGGMGSPPGGMGSPPSRGEIVRLVQPSNSVDRTQRMLEAWDLAAYPAFLLLVVSPTESAGRFTWNGRELSVERDVRLPVTTSSHRTSEVLSWRRSFYERMVGCPRRRSAAVRRMWKYHRAGKRGDPAFGVCMSREDARTVSFTRVTVRPVPEGDKYESGRGRRTAVFMSYLGAPPCESNTLPPALLLKHGTAMSTSVLDSRRMFRERAPDLARKLPPGTFMLLRRVFHEKLVNTMLLDLLHLDAVRFCDRVLSILNISVQVEGREHLDRSTRPVIAANHPTGAVDGLVLIAEVLRSRGNLLVPANEILMRLTPLEPFILPIDRYRGNFRVARSYAAAYEGDAPLLVFPAGRTARKRAGLLREYPWQKSFVTHSRRSGREIVPVWISGENSKLFYRLYRIRTALGIGLNIEMLFLIGELLRRRGDRVTVRFARAVSAGAGVEDEQHGGALLPVADRQRAGHLQRFVERELAFDGTR